MCRTPLWLLASLAFVSLSSLAEGAPLEVMIAPNLLRVGTEENIFVECQECETGEIVVHINVYNHPTKAKRLKTTSVTLNEGNDFQAFGKITLSPEDFIKDPDVKQVVYLQAQFPSRLLEKVVLLSFQTGYIYIQTDKTLYTPDSKVHFRIFGLTPSMAPIERSDKTDASINIDIMTPEGITIALEPVALKSGVHAGDFQLAEIVSPGLWKVIARFTSSPQQSFSSDFEVKEYVLPSFEVKLTPVSAFFYVDSDELTIDIRATYLFGKDVDGTAYVVFGVVIKDEKHGLPSSLQRVPIQEGRGVVTLKKEHILKTYPKIIDLVGDSLYVAVSVLTETGSEIVEAELKGIQIVTSPYTIRFKKTPKFFKPGMSFDFAVEVLNPDATPAADVPVSVTSDSGITEEGRTGNKGIARITLNTAGTDTRLGITATTKDPLISAVRQTSVSMQAVPYSTNGGNYILIGLDKDVAELGEELKMTLFIKSQSNQQNTHLTWMILSKGQVLQHFRILAGNQAQNAKRFIVSKDMLPSFRILAYYHTADNEVVSDSIWVEVQESCMGSLKLEAVSLVPSYSPRGTFSLKITGDPGAKVGLVAVDKGVYVLNNKHRLTQKKVWDLVEEYDTGCTSGGGADGLGVFYDAGVLFESNTIPGTKYRPDLKCPKAPSPSRRKRASIGDVITSLASRYKPGLERDCCYDGMKDTPLSYTCEMRAKYIIDGKSCSDAFEFCCNQLANRRHEMRQDELQLARSEVDDNSYMDSNEVVTRTNFPESWLWTSITLPPCPKSTPHCTTTSYENNIPLQESITTWQFTGISMSKTHGICVAKPLEVIVRKEFFIDLKLPYSAVRREQIEIKAILHNYSPDTIKVRVDLIEKDHVCSAASKRGKYRQEVTVGPKTTRSVPFVIIPMEYGQLDVEVKAVVKDMALSDGIMKSLRVVPEGVLVKSSQIIIIDPVSKGGSQVEVLNSGIPETSMVPKSLSSTEISLTGREQVGTMVEKAISGNAMGSLIVQPVGCGEQNMIYMTLPVIATRYLDNTNQWETIGFEKRTEALKHIKTGYTRELTFRKNDGSFSAFSSRPTSTWLTAYVAKVFSMAHSLVGIEKNVICDAVKYLILKTQQPDGVFKEFGPVIHGEMTGDVQGSDSDASMTAFCLIAMQESRSLCAASVNSLPEGIDNAVRYLEKRLLSLTNPYAVAMTSYALSNANKLNKEILLRFLSPDSTHVPVPRRRVFTLEATAYALLALIKAQDFDKAKPIVRWFNKQQKVGGGYGSTQATILVYQAVAEYWVNAKEPDYSLKVDLLMPGRAKADKLVFNKGNQYSTRTASHNEINRDVTVNATGTGEATLTMVSLYYAVPKEKASDCQRYNLSVQLLPDKPEGNVKVYKLKILYFFKDRDRDASMSILDIGLLTGFTVNERDLDLLSKGRARTISKYEMNSALSERGSLIIYLDKVSHTREEEISFRILQTFEVGVLQPAAVSIYDYYDPTRCVKFYHPQRLAGELLKLCTGDECTCAEENCSMQKKGKIDNDLRSIKSCESTETTKIDYIYKVEVDNSGNSGFTDIYTMTIKQVIKEGSLDVGPTDGQRTFLSYPHCREALDLIKGKTYLIMGSSKDIKKDTVLQTYQYVLGENIWLEYWPTQTECQTELYRPTCLGLNAMVQKYRRFGCRE